MIIPTTLLCNMQYAIAEAHFNMTQQNLSSSSALLSPKIDSELPTWYSILSFMTFKLHSLCSVSKTQKENIIPRTAPTLELLAVKKLLTYMSECFVVWRGWIFCRIYTPSFVIGIICYQITAMHIGTEGSSINHVVTFLGIFDPPSPFVVTFTK